MWVPVDIKMNLGAQLTNANRIMFTEKACNHLSEAAH